MLVKVIGIDRATGKIRLSRKEAMGKTPDVVHNFRAAASARADRARRMQLKFKRLRPGAVLPRYMTAGGRGHGPRRRRPTAPSRWSPGRAPGCPPGWAMEIPPGYEGQVRPRSGLASKHGVTVVNAPGPSTATTGGSWWCCW